MLTETDVKRTDEAPTCPSATVRPADREAAQRTAQCCVDGLLATVQARLAVLFKWDAEVAALTPVAVSDGGLRGTADELEFTDRMFVALRDVALGCVSGVLEDPGTPARASRAVRSGGHVVVVPVHAGGIVGALGVADDRHRVFPPDEVMGAVHRFAELASLVFANAALRRDLDALQASQRRVVESERLHAIGELGAGVAHHLNNIMTVILGNVELTLRRTPPGEGATLRAVRLAALEGAELVRRIGSFSRTQPVRDQALVDVNEIASDVLELTRARWQDEAQVLGVTIEARVERGANLKVMGDGIALREALLNLMLNAIDAVPNGGHIVLKTWDDGDAANVYCSVADDGVGMDDEARKRALEPFFTTKGLKSRGLGLSVAFGDIQQHGGTLVIERVEHRGTTITVSLPVRRSMSAATTRPRSMLKRRRILLVDDDASVRATLGSLLIDDGHMVVEAGSGAEALRALAAEPDVDIVFTDLGMPRMNGWELTNAIKKARPETRVVLITGWGETPQGARGHWLEPDVIIAKPVTEDTLRSLLAEMSKSAPC